MGLPAGASFAFFMASSNFLARMSSLFVSWNQESANLSSRWRCCSSRMLEACVRSTSGPFLGGASWERTAPKTGSTTSLAWQQGQITLRLSAALLLMARLYDCGSPEESRQALRPERKRGVAPCQPRLLLRTGKRARGRPAPVLSWLRRTEVSLRSPLRHRQDSKSRLRLDG